MKPQNENPAFTTTVSGWIRNNYVTYIFHIPQY